VQKSRNKLGAAQLENDNFSRFLDQAGPNMEYLSIFWAEKFVLVIIHQILPRNVEKIISSLHFLLNQFTLS
jgi:hypothetical protein